jgi:hypothetical protein
MDKEIVALTNAIQGLDPCPTVGVIPIDHALAVAPRGNVIEGAGKF